MKPAVEINSKYKKLFKEIGNKIKILYEGNLSYQFKRGRES